MFKVWKISQETKERIAKLFFLGCGTGVIAERLGLSRTSVQQEIARIKQEKKID